LIEKYALNLAVEAGARRMTYTRLTCDHPITAVGGVGGISPVM